MHHKAIFENNRFLGNAGIVRLTMQPQKKDIRLIRSLHLKKFRIQEGLFIAEGKKMVTEAIQSGHEIHSLFTTDEGFASDYPEAMMVNGKEMEQMSSFSSPSPYLAAIRQRRLQTIPAIMSDVLVLDGISDPGNFGTIMRSAEWFGIQQLICTQDCVEFYNPKVIQASMGSVLRMEASYMDEKLIGNFLAEAGFILIGAALGGKSVYDYHFEGKSAIVIGSESHGISPAIKDHLTVILEIPGSGRAESLNASVAAGVFMSELFRRRS
jgi:TrmH family RNA methyltransferase